MALGLSVLCATVAHAQFATAVGIVVDSIRGRPLPGATIVVSGSEMQGVSDSTGRFRIDSIAPGEHTMAVIHPWLDAMGLSLETNKITFAPGATMAVVLATPSAQSWIARRCSDADRQSGPGAISGHVFHPATDDPVTGALVHYTAVVLQAGKDIGLQHTTITRDASATPAGDFIICGVPAGSSGTIRATRGIASTGEVPVRLANQLLVSVTMRLAPEDTLAKHAGVVTGRIVDDKGAPIPAARVELLGTTLYTQATDSGVFTLRGLPLGSETLHISKVGFPEGDTTVTVSGGESVAIAVTLAAAPPASSEASLVSVGFVRRRAAGGGVFVTADTIEKRKARDLADLQPLFPGLMANTSQQLELTTTGASRCLWFVLDGIWYRSSSYRLDQYVPISTVLGIEYYEYGHVPKELRDRVQVSGFPHCAIMAIWTGASAR